MNGITIIKQDGGLGRVQTGTDAISGLLFYLAAVPDGWGDEPRLIPDLKTAEAAGLTDEAAPVAYYHVSEFFRMAGAATLYVHVVKIPESENEFSEAQDLVDFAEGKLRQMGVYTTAAWDVADVAKLQRIATASEVANTPLSAILYAPDFSTVEDVTALADLRGTGEGAPNSPKVSVILAQDGSGQGAKLYASGKKSVSALGCCLGTVASAAVNENIGWIEKFNLSDGVEMEVVALANGRLRPSAAVVDALNTKGYICAYKETDIAGTYFYDSVTACPSTSDYCYIDANRTMDKAIRGVRAALLPELRGTVYVDPDTGKLRAEYCANLEEVGNAPLEAMAKAGELSGCEVYIDPAQNVLSTSKIEIAIKNVPTGVVRLFEVAIGFTTSLS